MRSATNDPLANRREAERFGDLCFDFICEATAGLDPEYDGWAYGSARTAARFGLAALEGYSRRAKEIRW